MLTNSVCRRIRENQFLRWVERDRTADIHTGRREKRERATERKTDIHKYMHPYRRTDGVRYIQNDK